MESGLYKREGKALNNFTATLPDQQADLAGIKAMGNAP